MRRRVTADRSRVIMNPCILWRAAEILPDAFTAGAAGGPEANVLREEQPKGRMACSHDR